MKRDKCIVLTRRDFIRGTVGTALGTSFLGCGRTEANEVKKKKRAATITPNKIVVVRDKQVMAADRKIDKTVLKRMVDQCVLKLTGKTSPKEAWSAIVDPGDVVGLVTTDHLNPTHKELVEAVTDALRRFGIPEKNIVMAQGSLDGPKSCTALISMPALKAHWLTGIGTVLKNYIMFSGNPSAYHDEKSVKLGEIWNLPEVKGKTRLILVDALYPLCDKGPQADPRYQWTYKGLVAGVNPVALERVCINIIEAKRRALKGAPWPLSPPPICVEAAEKKFGLGTGDLKKIRLETIGWKEEILLT